MAQPLQRDIFRSWPGGVITSLRAEDLPAESSPRGENATLVGAGLGRAVVGKRRGATSLLDWTQPLGTITPAPTTTATVHSQHAYRRLVSGAYTYTHLAVVKESGELWAIDPAGAATSLSAALFGVNNQAPIWATFKNAAFALAGSVRTKVLAVSGALTAQNLGIVRPPARAATSFNWNATAGGTGVMSGDYEVALTFWNDTAQTESSRSDGYTVTGASADQLTLTWATSPDSQITHVRVHIRKVGTNVDFLRVTAGTNYVSGKGVPIASGTTVLDLSDSTILTFEASPDTVENNPPAVDASGASTDNLDGGLIHGGRLLVWSKTGFYYSKFDQPEQFDPESYEPVNPDDGQELVTCHKVSDDLVLVFKRRSMWGLVGNDPNTWSLELLDPSVGCVAPRSVVTIEGKTYWWSELGPMVWDGIGAPTQLGYQLVRDTTDPSQTNPEKWDGIVVHVDPPRQQLVFWIPSAGSLVNDKGLPFNYRLGVFESDTWNPFDVASTVMGEDETGRPQVYLGGYYGRLYLWWTADVDGARTTDEALAASGVAGTVVSYTPGASTVGVSTNAPNMENHGVSFADAEGVLATRRVTGVGVGAGPSYSLVIDAPLPEGFTPTTFVVDPSYDLAGTITAASSVGSYTRITVAGAIFDYDLIGHAYAYVSAQGEAPERRRIVNVTYPGGGASALDLFPALEGAVSDVVGRRVVIASPLFLWDTHWADSGEPFKKKRYGMVSLAGVCGNGDTDTVLEVYTSYDLGTPVRRFIFPVATSGALFDEDRFDLSVFGGGEGRSTFRRNVGRLANSYRLRVRNADPDRQFVLLALGMDAALLGDRR